MALLLGLSGARSGLGLEGFVRLYMVRYSTFNTTRACGYTVIKFQRYTMSLLAPSPRRCVLPGSNGRRPFGPVLATRKHLVLKA